MSRDNEYRPGGMFVRVKNNDVGRALQKLKKIVQKEKLFQEVRMREYYEPPSVVRKRDKAKAIKRWQKKLTEMKELDLPPVDKKKKKFESGM